MVCTIQCALLSTPDSNMLSLVHLCVWHYYLGRTGNLKKRSYTWMFWEIVIFQYYDLELIKFITYPYATYIIHCSTKSPNNQTNYTLKKYFLCKMIKNLLNKTVPRPNYKHCLYVGHLYDSLIVLCWAKSQLHRKERSATIYTYQTVNNVHGLVISLYSCEIHLRLDRHLALVYQMIFNGL